MSVSPTDNMDSIYPTAVNISRNRNTAKITPAAVSVPDMDAKSTLGAYTQPERPEQQLPAQLIKQAVTLLQILDGHTIFEAYATILANLLPINQSQPKKLLMR